MSYEIRPTTCESACTRLKRAMPYRWDCNLYRGCAHGCRYCYAVGSHKHLTEDSFENAIYVKTNIVEALERQLSAPGWVPEVINLGGVTDSYQPAEAQCKLMPEILRLLIRYKTPAIISTKSDLVLRDFDLVDELSRITYINVAASVVTMDEALQKKLEPGAVSPARRLAMLKEFKKTNASTGVHCMPIIPCLTDSPAGMEALIAAAADSGVDYLLPGVMYLRGAYRQQFMDFAQREFPEVYPRLLALYAKGGAGQEYKQGLYEGIVNPLRKKYGVSSSYSAPMKQKLAEARAREPEQLSML